MRSSPWFTCIVALFVTTLIVSNIVAVKLVEVAGFVLPAAVISQWLVKVAYEVAATPLTYLIVG